MYDISTSFSPLLYCCRNCWSVNFRVCKFIVFVSFSYVIFDLCIVFNCYSVFVLLLFWFVRVERVRDTSDGLERLIDTEKKGFICVFCCVVVVCLLCL
jgi:hypothetical protein